MMQHDIQSNFETDTLLEPEIISNFFETITHVAANAARLGARKVAAIYGASPEKLQTEYKAEAGMSPRTVADWQSESIITQVIRRTFPTHSIHKEEAGLQEGQDFTWYVDPLDGTSSFVAEQRYSTVGVSVYDQNDLYLSAAIVSPFERELLVSERGKGAYLYQLNDRFSIQGKPRRLKVSHRTSLSGGMVYLDASFNTKTWPSKIIFMQSLIHLALGPDRKGKVGFRMTGSNIDQQRQVAAGRCDLGLTDAIGGPYDWRTGYAIIHEAGGIMLDGMNGEPPSNKTEVVIYGNKDLVTLVLPYAKEAYRNYLGFK